MKCLRNCWYPAAHSEWLRPASLQRRVIVEEGLVFFRGRDGLARALADRCPHRFARLSLGALTEQTVKCKYHGLEFGFDGRCVLNPHGNGKIPDRLSVGAYPVEERHGFIWVWMGENARADASLIPNLSWLDEASPNATYWGSDQTPVNYQLSQDNLMDFSHVDHLHTAFESTGLSGATGNVRLEKDSVVTDWEWDADQPYLFYRDHMPSGPVRSWTRVTWRAPATIIVWIGSVTRGGRREDGCYSLGVHALCPETGATTHHNYALTRNYALDDAELTNAMRAALGSVNMAEDVPMIQSCQEEMGGAELLDLHPVLLQNDKGVIGARKLLDRLIKAEIAASSAAAQP